MGGQCCSETHDDHEFIGLQQNLSLETLSRTESGKIKLKGGVDNSPPKDCKKTEYMHPKAPVAKEILISQEPKLREYGLSVSNMVDTNIQGPYLFFTDNSTYVGEFENGNKNGVGEQV